MDSDRWRRRLTRSSHERMWAGVAGGLAEYFDVDPTLVRLMWVIATIITAGLFVAVYLVMWVIMPLDSELADIPWKSPAQQEEPAGEFPGGAAGPAGPAPNSPPFSRHDYWHETEHYHHVRRKRRSGGIVLIALGLLFLGAQSGVFHWINWSVAWAVVLIAVGAALLFRHSDWRM